MADERPTLDEILNRPGPDGECPQCMRRPTHMNGGTCEFCGWTIYRKKD